MSSKEINVVLRSKPRVLVVSYTYYPVVGGLPQQAHLLNRTLKKLGVSVILVTAQIHGHPKHEVLDDVPIYRLWTIKGSPTSYRSRIYPWLLSLALFLIQHRYEYDVIHVHQAAYHAAVCVIFGKLFAKPVVIRVTGSGSSGNIAVLKRWWWLGSIVRRIIRHANCFVSLSEDITAELLAEHIPAEKIAHIENGLDTAFYAPESRKSDAITNGIVVGVGRFTEEKGFDILIESWPKVIRQHPEAYLVIVGDGQDSAVLKELAANLGIMDNVSFEGNRDNVIDYLAKAKIFVLPSRNEGMSNALLEAMSTGCACIVSDIPANRSLVTSGDNALLFRTNDPNDLSNQVIRLLTDPQLCTSLGANARKKILGKFSIDEKAQEYLDLYSQLWVGKERSQ